MKLLKCTTKNCNYVLSDDQLPNLDYSKNIRKCPECGEQKLARNTADPVNRKKWFAYFNQDRSVIECAVLVVFDSFSDDSNEVIIPLLNLQFCLQDKLKAIHRARDEINNYLKAQYDRVYENERQFITIAFQNEKTELKQNVPAAEMLFQD